MRDSFRFRVWDTDDKKYSDEWCVSSLGFNVPRIIPEQCTGLKDKNGKLIYEGDIVREISKKEPEYEEYIIEVKWCDCGYNLYDNNLFDLEVIGNIHENPELLEDGDER